LTNWGTWAAGAWWPRPTPEHLTCAAGSSSSANSLLPTPRASPGEQRQTRRSPSQNSRRRGRSLAAEIGELADPDSRLLPTPTACDGAKGSPGRRYSNGPTLSCLAARISDQPKLLPTPRASDTGTPGRKAGPGYRPPLSQVVLPMATQGPASSTGASTPPPSAAGRTSSDDPPPHPADQHRRLRGQFAEWLQGLDEGWICDVPALTRADQLRLAGGGVNVLQGELALRLLLDLATAPRH
jgi:hypothetical protein